MTVFKTFLKVLKAYKVPIIMYTVFLVFFGTINMKTSDNNINFILEKPSILIVNNDENTALTQSFINYISSNADIVDIDENLINDALFYREINYIIYIPNNFQQDFLEDKATIEVKSTGNYQSSIAEMLVSRYLKIANVYKKIYPDINLMIEKTEGTLATTSEVEFNSRVNTDDLSNATFFYNFMNYSLLAGCVYAICLILSSFKSENVKKRTNISSMNFKKYNKYLLLSNGLFALILWLIYILLSFILIGNIMFTMHGLIYIINSFIFGICALTIAFLIANITCNKQALSGIVNVVSLGSSFLCGSFVPMELLPDFVLKIAHFLPSYWYVKSNELLKTIDIISFNTLKPIINNMLMIVLFIILFILLTNFISSKKRKIN